MLSKTNVVESGLIKGGVGKLDSLDYFVIVGLKGEGTILPTFLTWQGLFPMF
jgi:hypothetical protein